MLFQFLLGSAHVLKQPLFRQACEVAFSDCDVNGKNYILKQEVYIYYPALRDPGSRFPCNF